MESQRGASEPGAAICDRGEDRELRDERNTVSFLWERRTGRAPRAPIGDTSVFASLLLTVFACWGCANAAPESSIPDPDPLLVEVGAELFATYCASCHGIDGRGDGPAASALTTPPTDLTRIAARSVGVFPEGAIARKIDGRFDQAAHGSPEMPVWGMRLAEEIPDLATGEEVARGRIASLIEYLKSIQVK